VVRKNGAKYKPYSAVSDGLEIEPDESDDGCMDGWPPGVVKTSESEPHPGGHAKEDSKPSGSYIFGENWSCLLADPYVVSGIK
jgi:hypothetical protein